MRSISIRRPSASLVLAFVALLAALGGTSYAAATISGKDLKVRSIPGNRVANNVLTGTQVKESALGLVPKAAFAFSAQTAKLADNAKLAESAKTADSAKTAETAKTADTATKALTADTATLATKAQDSDKLGGRTPSQYVRSLRTVRIGLVSNVAANATVEVQRLCAVNEVAVGGGGGWFIVNTDTAVASATISASYPVTDAGTGADGFRMEGKNTSPVARDARAYAVCLAVG